MKRYSEITRKSKPSGLLPLRRALPGKKRVKRDPEELHNILRLYTYHLIGMGNAFRRVARDFSALDGSNWRNNRGCVPEVMEYAKQLYSTNPYDVDAIIKIERALEAIFEKHSKPTKGKRGAK